MQAFKSTDDEYCPITMCSSSLIQLYEKLTRNNVYWYYNRREIGKMHCPADPDMHSCVYIDYETYKSGANRFFTPYPDLNLLALRSVGNILEEIYTNIRDKNYAGTPACSNPRPQPVMK